MFATNVLKVKNWVKAMHCSTHFPSFFADFSNKQIYKNVKEIVQKCLKSTIFVIILPKRIKHSGKQVKMFMLSTALIVRMVCDEAEV